MLKMCVSQKMLKARKHSRHRVIAKRVWNDIAHHSHQYKCSAPKKHGERDCSVIYNGAGAKKSFLCLDQNL